MKVYFYCSYEHSVKGFFPLCVTKERVVPCDGNGEEKMPDEVWDFFSYDRFKILWREFAKKDGGHLFPEPVKSIFGIRGIEGNIGAKKGVVNIAFFADEEELAAMEKLALSVLDGYDEFTKMLFAFLSIGGDWGYSVDEKRLFSYLEGLKLNDKTSYITSSYNKDLKNII